MRRLVVLACMFVVAASTAEARHRHRYWHGYHLGVAPYAYRFVTAEKKLQRQRAWRESVRKIWYRRTGSFNRLIQIGRGGAFFLRTDRRGSLPTHPGPRPNRLEYICGPLLSPKMKA